MPRSIQSFLAPAFFEPGEINEAGEHKGRNYRSVGLTSMMPLSKLPPGMCCLWPATVPVEVVRDSTPAEWDRFSVVVVPNLAADRTRIYAWLTLRGATAFVGPDEVALVVPPDDASVRAGFKRIDLARIPDAFWAEYGPDYGGPLVGEYLPVSYRVTVEFTGETAFAAPSSWLEYRRDLSGATPYPLPDVSMLSTSDRARNRRRAEERALQILKAGG